MVNFIQSSIFIEFGTNWEYLSIKLQSVDRRLKYRQVVPILLQTSIIAGGFFNIM
jgi:hypothetical protein